MRVAFDHQIFLLPEYGGISRYVCSLAKGLVDIQKGVETRIVAPLHFNAHLQESEGVPVTGFRVPRINHTGRIVAGLSQFAAKVALRAFHPDVVHETYYSRDGAAPPRCPVVVTVYDMIVERFPAMFSREAPGTELKRASVERADYVLCISESTKRDLIELFDYPEEKISVVYLGYEKFPFFAGLQKNASMSQIDTRPYFLYVGSRAEYKNFKSLLQAIASSRQLKDHFRLVCFGGGPFSPDENELIKELGFSESQVTQVGGGDETLANLYANAAAFVYPSLYEGFGIPPLEAMSLGCPVLCSNTSSLPEVVGDAGEYFDPSRIDSIADAIERVMDSSATRASLVANGMKRCASFSWARCAEETLAVYRRVV
ncbi:MAG: glycosyltransferase family 1 protein [Betaproteobacteria bacterium]